MTQKCVLCGKSDMENGITLKTNVQAQVGTIKAKPKSDIIIDKPMGRPRAADLHVYHPDRTKITNFKYPSMYFKQK